MLVCPSGVIAGHFEGGPLIAQVGVRSKSGALRAKIFEISGEKVGRRPQSGQKCPRKKWGGRLSTWQGPILFRGAEVRRSDESSEQTLWFTEPNRNHERYRLYSTLERSWAVLVDLWPQMYRYRLLLSTPGSVSVYEPSHPCFKNISRRGSPITYHGGPTASAGLF